MTRSSAVLLAAASMTLVSQAAVKTDTVPARAEVTRKVYISATGANNVPVTDLTAADITVKEGGKERPITSLLRAVAPMDVAILVDDAGLGAFQSAIGQFIQKIFSRAQFSITLLNPQALKIVDFTNDGIALRGALGRLGPRGRAQADGDQMLDAIFQAARALQQRKSGRPVIVALTVAGGQPQSVEPTDVLTALRASGAGLNVVYITGADLGMVLGDGPRHSGGRIEQAGTGTAIAPSLLRIADALEHQYQLTYTLPDGVKMSDRISVATSRKGITLTSPTRISDK
jgi:hypothetical protein